MTQDVFGWYIDVASWIVTPKMSLHVQYQPLTHYVQWRAAVKSATCMSRFGAAAGLVRRCTLATVELHASKADRKHVSRSWFYQAPNPGTQGGRVQEAIRVLHLSFTRCAFR
jgi:hypothetical protein